MKKRKIKRNDMMGIPERDFWTRPEIDHQEYNSGILSTALAISLATIIINAISLVLRNLC